MTASAASEITLQVNTADLPPNISRYGLYICFVNLSGILLQQSVKLDKRDWLFNVVFLYNNTHEILCVFQIDCRYNRT